MPVTWVYPVFYFWLIASCNKDIIKCFSPLSSTVSKPLLSSATYESHDEKNMRLKRPLSPHLTIYQVQLTALLSVTHRTTGIMLASYAMFLGLGKTWSNLYIQFSLSNVCNINMSKLDTSVLCFRHIAYTRWYSMFYRNSG